MKLFYTTRLNDFEAGYAYRNPEYFQGVESAESVTVEGGYPHIVDAYKQSEVDVKVLEIESSDAVTRESIADMLSDDVNELLEAHGVEAKGKLPERKERLIKVMFVSE